MSLRGRIGAALALLAAFAGLGGQLATHGHELGEVDLVAHSIVAIEHAPAAAEHFDRADEVEHPSCGACLLASLRTSQPAPTLATDPVVASALELPLRDEPAPTRFRARRAPARAPPFA